MEFAYPPYAIPKPRPPPQCTPIAPLLSRATFSTKLRMRRTKADRQSGERYFSQRIVPPKVATMRFMRKMSISKAHPPPFFPPCWRFLVLGDCVLHTSPTLQRNSQSATKRLPHAPISSARYAFVHCKSTLQR